MIRLQFRRLSHCCGTLSETRTTHFAQVHRGWLGAILERVCGVHKAEKSTGIRTFALSLFACTLKDSLNHIVPPSDYAIGRRHMLLEHLGLVIVEELPTVFAILDTVKYLACSVYPLGTLVRAPVY